MATMQDVLDQARLSLNDDSKTRYTDANLLKFAIAGLLRARQTRPDVFIGKTVPAYTFSTSTTFPIADDYIMAIADYVSARAESVDAEFNNEGKAAMFVAAFGGAMNG